MLWMYLESIGVNGVVKPTYDACNLIILLRGDMTASITNQILCGSTTGLLGIQTALERYIKFFAVTATGKRGG